MKEKKPMQDWYEEKVSEVLIRGGRLDGEPKIINVPHGYYHGEMQDICPSILTKCTQYNYVVLEPIKNFIMEKKINVVGNTHKGMSGVVYGTDGIAGTITTNKGDGPLIAAMRGRNPDNPSERGRSNGKYQQRLEINEHGTSNTITSVQKDNVVIEPVVYDDYNSKIREDQDTIGTITTNIGNSAPRNGFKIIEPTVLGWTRDSKVNVIDRHPVEVANCVTAAKRDNTQNYVAIPTATKDGAQIMEVGGVCDISYPNSKTRRGRVQEGGTVTPALTCGCESSLARIEAPYRIRKLTERECFRLMGVRDEDSDKIRAAVSKSQCYKLAGNSIVVDVMVCIFDQLLFGNKNKNQQLEIF